MEEIDFTLMSNIAEEVEREHEGLLPFTEMVNIMLAKYHAAQQNVQRTGLTLCPKCGFDKNLLEYRECAVCKTPRR